MTGITGYLAGAAFLIGLALGVFIDNKIHVASQVAQMHKEVQAAQAGEVKIIHDTQVIYKDIQHDAPKNKCLTTAVPTDINSQLR